MRAPSSTCKSFSGVLSKGADGATDMAFSRGKHESMAKNHGLPLLSSLPERFAWRCRFAPSVDRLDNGLSPVGNALQCRYSGAVASPFA